MNWSDWTMEQTIAAIIGGSCGIIAVVIGNIFSERNIYKKLQGLIGKSENETLVNQHHNIENQIKEKSKELKEQSKEQSKIINGDIRKLLDYNLKAEVLTQNLSLDQREVKNNVSQLINQWQVLIKENQALKEENSNLKKRLSKLNIEENAWENEM